MINYYQKTTQEVFKEFKTSPKGISEEEARQRSLKFGANIIKEKKIRSPFFILISQFANFLIILLVFAFLISLFVQPLSHSLVLLLIIIFNVLMGFVLEWKAEKSLEALKRIFAPMAVVIREGKEKIVPASELVPGDIVLLNQGSRVAADVRIFEAQNLEIDESALTGESIPSRKFTDALPTRTSLADQENMAFCGTVVTNGQGKGVVVATASKTELGKIAASVQKKSEKTPLQKRLDFLGKVLTAISLVVVLLIFLIGLLRDESPLKLFNYTISLLVSAVPESLPTIITLALAIGVFNMAKHKTIVRRLTAVETLAGVNVLCVDKTGTLTKNEMTVLKIWTPKEGEIEVQGEGYLPEPKFKAEGDLRKLIKAGFLCNKAILDFDKEKGRWQIIGDPTEGALLVLGRKAEIEKELEDNQKIHEILFEEKRRLMSVVFKEKGRIFVYTKGAPESVLLISKIAPKEKKRVESEIKKLTKAGFRVLGIGYKELKKGTKLSEEEIEKDLKFLGLVGLVDPPAQGAKEAIRLCQKAQIKPVIISGDHKLTTIAVARQLGLKVKEENVLTGEELEVLSEEELFKIIDKIAVFARTSPTQKTKILSAFQKKGYQVAMTGDGINDASALKQADIGIAMGLRGQDIAKEVSDLILVDDQLETLEKAIEYARNIYENLRKFITYLLSSNYTELVLVTLAFVFDLPLPLTPLQILWINLITESGPALALVAEKPRKEIMTQPPKDNVQIIKSFILPILRFAFLFAFIGIIISAILFVKYLPYGESTARSMVFTFIVFFELTIIISLRQEVPFWRGGLFSNKYLIWAILFSIFFQLSALYTPISQILGAAGLTLSQWFLILGVCFGCFLILEFAKTFRRAE